MSTVVYLPRPVGPTFLSPCSAIDVSRSSIYLTGLPQKLATRNAVAHVFLCVRSFIAKKRLYT
jgi:hypothetical protein